jgi:hypothetical protein
MRIDSSELIDRGVGLPQAWPRRRRPADAVAETTSELANATNPTAAPHMAHLAGLDVIGVAGESLHDRWGLDPHAYLSVAVSPVRPITSR